jgi:hypothetical protein
MASKPTDFAAPLGSATSGRLEFARGASRVTLRVDGDLLDLARARFLGVVPMVLADDGRMTIEYPLVSPSEWLRPNRRAADVALNPSLPWDVVFSRGVSKLRADLAGLSLRSLEIGSGANDVELDLPEPQGVVPLRVKGGVSKVTLRRPAGVPVSLVIAGGASKIALDDQAWGSIGGETRLASLDADGKPDRYEIEIGGGASQLTIAEGEPGTAA